MTHRAKSLWGLAAVVLTLLAWGAVASGAGYLDGRTFPARRRSPVPLLASEAGACKTAGDHLRETS